MNRRARTDVVKHNRIFGITVLKNGYFAGTRIAYYGRKLAEGGSFTGYLEDLRK